MKRTEICQQIAKLVNDNNHLSCELTPERVKENYKQYKRLILDDKVAWCVRVRRTSWYQSEVSHLSVHPDHQGKKMGKEALAAAEKKALDNNSKVLCCTIRDDNIKSINLFERMGYAKVTEFTNECNGRTLLLYVKKLCPPSSNEATFQGLSTEP